MRKCRQPYTLIIIVTIVTLLLVSAFIFISDQNREKTDWNQYLNCSPIIQRILHEQINFTSETAEECLFIPVELIFQNVTIANELLRKCNVTNVRIAAKEEFEESRQAIIQSLSTPLKESEFQSRD